jgi:poly-gamma-glutamate capsule biosynthesis protein CapA/YwtB (metallophosphatase superfamily)
MLTLFLAGDVMTGRGIDQILPHPSAPHLFEAYAQSALDYVELAEQVAGPIARPVASSYVWGAALAELNRVRPDVRIVNLETAVTAAEDAWPGKGIHYRMHPANVSCLSAARIDCCVLANNHVLDWGYAGLIDSLQTLHRQGIETAGAGRNAGEAAAPAVIKGGSARVMVYAFCTRDSGVAPEWAADQRRAGVNLLHDLSAASVDAIARQVQTVKNPGDLVLASIHWGGNWGYAIDAKQRAFAHRLIDHAQVDVVHGHSSHHVKGIEVYGGKLILYGCGDFLNDYEGIHGHQQYRAHLALMYFPTLDNSSGRLLRLTLVPMRICRFQLAPASAEDAHWLLDVLNREGRGLDTAFTLGPDGRLSLTES